eukprot:g328.t1
MYGDKGRRQDRKTVVSRESSVKKPSGKAANLTSKTKLSTAMTSLITEIPAPSLKIEEVIKESNLSEKLENTESGNIAESGNVDSKKFSFQVIQSSFPKEKAELKSFEKWGLDKHCVFRRFRFNQRLTDENMKTFLLDFFNDSTVQASLQISTRKSGLCPCPGGEIRDIKYIPLNKKVTNMTFFDRLITEADVVHDTGGLRKCFDDMIDGVSVQDKLTEMLVNEDSENADIYDDDEKNEFIYQIFRTLVVGGSLCQAEESWDDYKTHTKSIYKQLVKVIKNATTGKIEVSSDIFSVEELTGTFNIFPEESPHNRCYIVVDKSSFSISYWTQSFVNWW